MTKPSSLQVWSRWGISLLCGVTSLMVQILPFWFGQVHPMSPDKILAAGAITGADLQAMLSTAQLNAIHDRLSELGKEAEEDDKRSGQSRSPIVEVSQQHLWDAFIST